MGEFALRESCGNGGLLPYDRPLAELLSQVAQVRPDGTAVDEPGRRLTYAELTGGARRFARGLHRMGVGPGDVVAVAGGRGADACVALVGIVFAGATYLPLDVSLPDARVRGMVEDAAAVAVVRLPCAGHLVDGVAKVWEYEQVWDAGGDASGPMLAGADAAAYVMFTSGTTGRPKAVAVPQRGVARLAVRNGFMELGPGDRVLHAATLSFDASVLEMWPALLNGATLVPVESEVLLAPFALHEFIRRERITVVFLTTAVFHLVARDRPQTFAGLRYVLTGGEALHADAARTVLERGRPEHLINAYGPTEAACVALAHRVEEVAPGAAGVPIGCPIADTVCAVLRDDGMLAEDGEEGELYLGGGGIASGYLNHPEESERRFVTLDVGDGTGPQRLYRTGDFVSRRPDGVVEFRGRRDDQVKVRGFRIELDEVRRPARASGGGRRAGAGP